MDLETNQQLVDLRNLRKNIDSTSNEIAELENQLRRLEHQRRGLVGSYVRARLEYIRETMEKHHITWCTKCNLPIETGKSTLMLFEESKLHSGCNEGCLNDVTQFHRLCEECRDTALDHHGSVGAYLPDVGGQEKFYAFRVEMHDGSLDVRRFGIWGRLDVQKHPLPPISEETIALLPPDWEIPPQISLEEDGYRGKRLLIAASR